jgi:hypothetical protein
MSPHRPPLFAWIAALMVAGPAGAAVVPDGTTTRAGESPPHRPEALWAGDLAPIRVDDGVLFRLNDSEARRVSVVGNFNGWNERATPLEKTRHGLWRTVLDLEDGTWTYLFVVDGDWRLDPDNPIVHRDPGEEGSGDTSFLDLRNGEVVAPRSAQFREADVEMTGRYDRVDQFTLGADLRYENRARLHPELHLGGSRSFGRDRWLFDVGIVQPVGTSEALDLGVRVYRETATPDRHRMGDTENSLATFFFREDWRDYHEAEGIALHAAAFVGPVARLVGTWKDEDHTSVSKTTDWGLFGGDTRMRANLPVDEGQLRSFTLEADVDTRNSERNPSRGFWATGRHEWAGGDLGGDFEFRRAIADFRRYLKLSRGHFLDFRVLGGLIDGARRGGTSGTLTGFDAVPVQERFYLGGTGTMRATQFKSLTGDRMLLANAEMRVEVFREFQAVAFVDIGDAWIDATAEPALKTDAGIGFQDSDSSFRLNVAKKLDGRGDEDGIFVSARIQRMF